MKTAFSCITAATFSAMVAFAAPPVSKAGSAASGNGSASPTGMDSAHGKGMGGSDMPASKASMDANKNAYRTVIEECLNKGNLSVADKYIAKDMVDHDSANQMGGLQGFKNFVTNWRSSFPDSRMEIQSIVSDGDRIMARVRTTGTHTGMFNGIAPTNKKFNVEGFDEVLFKNGKAVEHWGVFDQAAMMRQLGLMPSQTAQPRPSSAPAAPSKQGTPGSNKY